MNVMGLSTKSFDMVNIFLSVYSIDHMVDLINVHILSIKYFSLPSSP